MDNAEPRNSSPIEPKIDQENIPDKPFRFLDLPEELQYKTLVYILGGLIRPHVANIIPGLSKAVLGSRKNNATPFQARLLAKFESTADVLSLDWMTERIASPNYAIFQASKEMQRKALRAGWIGTVKHFSDIGIFLDVATCHILPPVPNWLARVRLTLDLPSLFEFFAVSVSNRGTFEYDPTQAPAVIFNSRQLSHLETLEIEFPNPYEEDILTPWSNLMWVNRHDDQWKQEFSWMRKYPCYKTMVDWLLTFAYPNLERVPKVKLVGCIKDSTRAKWEKIFSERTKSYKTIEYNHQSTLEEILSTPATALPPACECPQSCYASDNVYGTFTFDHADVFDAGTSPWGTNDTQEWDHIEWVVAAAYGFVKYMPKVVFTGYGVDADVREKWRGFYEMADLFLSSLYLLKLVWNSN
ncbi:hypothetical protein DM02DRAFT_711291 [Periconia macrospinosa]|uniref:Uncharacterized protein n=1 Tax=Periconia macrospinosa TaxID=97972 RepID=A0A2V1DQS1_9PLEO|nr:hypothetical protein DM02DRAFT_711291 [Periconia macrospinosa]